ncbi:MAG: hypothetical protein ACR2FI_09755, partial [Burkholderiales bacterium]
AIRRAVMRATENGDANKLDALADTLIKRGLDGDITAIKEIGDRLDGKPRQQAEITDADGEPLLFPAVQIYLPQQDRE